MARKTLNTPADTAGSTRFFVYARKSTDDAERQVRSIGDQLAELKELAAKEELIVTETFLEKQSAKYPGRPIFNEMLDRIEAGEASGILAWHPDRLARNSLDGGRVIHLLDTGRLRALRFPTVPFDATPSGKFMLGMLFSQSKYYVDNLSENIRRGQRQKLKAGIFPQWAPMGYLNDRRTKTISIDPVRGPLIRKAFELYATGRYPLRHLRDTLNELGLVGKKNKPLGVGNVQYLLQNPVYYGLIRFNGELHEGVHEPLVSKALFDKCQEVMSRRSRPKGRVVKPFLYRGLFTCGSCGGMITMERQKGHTYLRCTKKKGACAEPYIREEEIVRQVAEHVRSLALPDRWAEWLLNELDHEEVKASSSRQSLATALQARLDQADARLQRLTDAYLDEAIDLSEYRAKKATLLNERQLLKEKLAAPATAGATWLEPFRTFIKASNEGVFVAEDGDSVSQRDFLTKTGSNLTLQARQLQVAPRGPWKLVEKQGLWPPNQNAAPDSGAAQSRQNGDLSKQRRGGDSNSRDPDGSTGFRNREGNDVGGGEGVGYGDGSDSCDGSCALIDEQRDQLDTINAAWLDLPPHIRAAVMMLVKVVSD